MHVGQSHQGRTYDTAEHERKEALDTRHRQGRNRRLSEEAPMDGRDPTHTYIQLPDLGQVPIGGSVRSCNHVPHAPRCMYGVSAWKPLQQQPLGDTKRLAAACHPDKLPSELSEAGSEFFRFVQSIREGHGK